MHCNLRQPDATQSLATLTSSPVPSSKSLSLSVAVLEHFYCLYVTLRCDLELLPRDLDLWPWTFVVCRLCRSQTLYEIWAQSGNSRRSYGSLKFDLLTSNMYRYHVLRYALRYFTQNLNSVKLSVHEMWRLFHANTSFHAMTLIFDSLTLKVCRRSDDTCS